MILYFLWSVPVAFLMFTVKEPSFIGDFRFISKSSFWSYRLEGSSPSYMSFIDICSLFSRMEALGVANLAVYT